VPPPQTTGGATTLELKVDRKPFDVSTGIDFNHPGVQGLLSATENGLTSLGEQLSVSALLPKRRVGRDRARQAARIAQDQRPGERAADPVVDHVRSTYDGKPALFFGLPR
jgi:hemolysin activation/secretion protein